MEALHPPLTFGVLHPQVRQTGRVPKKAVSDYELAEIFANVDRERKGSVPGASLANFISQEQGSGGGADGCGGRARPWLEGLDSALERVLRYLSRQLRALDLEPEGACNAWDIDRSRSLSASEFDVALSDMEVVLSVGEKRLLVNCLDIRGDGAISTDALLVHLRDAAARDNAAIMRQSQPQPQPQQQAGAATTVAVGSASPATAAELVVGSSESCLNLKLSHSPRRPDPHTLQMMQELNTNSADTDIGHFM